MKTIRKEVLGEELRKERAIRHLSQETIGKAVGVGKTTISAYERGVISPPLDRLEALCEYFGLELIDFLKRCQDICRQQEET